LFLKTMSNCLSAALLLTSTGLAIAQNRILNGLSPDGVNFVAAQCKSERLISMHVDTYRKWQLFNIEILEKIRSKEIDQRLYNMYIREVIERDLDEKSRSRRNRPAPSSQAEALRLTIADITFDLMHLSAMKIFLSNMNVVEDIRLKRLLEENCLSILFSND